MPSRDLGRGEPPLWWRVGDMQWLVSHLTADPRSYLEFLVDIVDRLVERPSQLYWHMRWIEHVRLQDWTAVIEELRR
jgi:hypothetical protein